MPRLPNGPQALNMAFEAREPGLLSAFGGAWGTNEEASKLPLGKRGTLLLFLGIPLLLLLAASLYLGFSPDALQADFDKMQIGMPLAQVREILTKRDGTFYEWERISANEVFPYHVVTRRAGTIKVDAPVGSRPGAKSISREFGPEFEFQQSNSLLFPGGRISGSYDVHRKLLAKNIIRPSRDDIWNYWKRQLGL